MARLLTSFSSLSLNEKTEEGRLLVSLSAMDLDEDSFDAPASPSKLSELISTASQHQGVQTSHSGKEKLEMCTEQDCPVEHPHQKGGYQYQNEAPHKYDFLLGSSNPPPHVWESLAKMTTGDSSAEDDLAVVSFLRYHASDRTYDWASICQK